MVKEKSFMETIMQITGGILCFLMHIPLVLGIKKDTIEQSFASWLLWSILDTIALISSLLEESNYYLPCGSLFGSIIVAFTLYYKKQITWSPLDTYTALLTIGCIFVWYSVGNIAAIIASVSIIGISSISQIELSFRKPKSTPAWIYAVFALASAVSFFGGKDWSIEERFYAGATFFVELLLMIISMKTIEQQFKKE